MYFPGQKVNVLVTKHFCSWDWQGEIKATEYDKKTKKYILFIKPDDDSTTYEIDPSKFRVTILREKESNE